MHIQTPFAAAVLRVLHEPAVAMRLRTTGPAYAATWSANDTTRHMADLYASLIAKQDRAAA